MGIFQKMMAIAGRDTSGEARAIKTDFNGNVGVQVTRSENRETVHHDNTSTTGNGTIADVSGYSTLTIQVSGTFEGEIYARGRVFGTKSENLVNFLPIFTNDGKQINRITKSGIYYVNVSGLNGLFLRLNELVSGSVTVRSMTSAFPFTPNKPLDLSESTQKIRNILLGRVSGIEVDSKSSKNLTGDILLDRYSNNGNNLRPFSSEEILYCYIVCRTDSVHNYQVAKTYLYPVGEFGSSTGPNIVFNPKREDGLRFVSEWEEVNGNTFGVRVNNAGDEVHKYDILVYGVM